MKRLWRYSHAGNGICYNEGNGRVVATITFDHEHCTSTAKTVDGKYEGTFITVDAAEKAVNAYLEQMDIQWKLECDLIKLDQELFKLSFAYMGGRYPSARP